MNNETSERAKRSKNIVLPLGQNTSEMTTKLFKPTSHPQIDQNYEKIRLEPQKKNFKRMIEEMLWTRSNVRTVTNTISVKMEENVVYECTNTSLPQEHMIFFQ